MRRGRALLLCSLALLAGTTSLALANPGAARAYADIVGGHPKYFYVRGESGGWLRHAPPLHRALEDAGVDVVGTGCIFDAENDDYNAVILRHFHP